MRGLGLDAAVAAGHAARLARQVILGAGLAVLIAVGVGAFVVAELVLGGE